MEFLRSKEKDNLFDLPSFYCKTADDQSELLLHCYDARMRNEWDAFVVGVVKCAAKIIFEVDVTMFIVETVENFSKEDLQRFDSNYHYAVFKIRKSNGGDLHETSLASLQHERRNHSTSPQDLKISVPTLCSTFPFLVIFDQTLQIQQLGSALIRRIGHLLSAENKTLSKYFELLHPKIRFTFPSVLGRKYGSFLLRLKSDVEKTVIRSPDRAPLELRGEMIHLPESDCILFLGSPHVARMDQLKGRELFLSDIPLHDATRDLFLVSEQAVVQGGLMKRVHHLKTELQQASLELEQEKLKTEDLLDSIFPRDVAKQLIHRQPVPARFIDDVTILFSDTVGFTSICGKCTPMDVVNMLRSLFTEFDRNCGQLLLTKVITRIPKSNTVLAMKPNFIIFKLSWGSRIWSFVGQFIHTLMSQCSSE